MPVVAKKPVIDWVEEDIIVKLRKDGSLPVNVTAMVFGPLAVYPSMEDLKLDGVVYPTKGSEWDLIHVPTQMIVGRFKELDDAIKVAEFMWTKLDKLLDSDLPCKQIKEMFPRWLFPWVKSVRMSKAWVDPKQFTEVAA